MDHSYAVLGLGRFGRTVAKALFEAGKDVMIVDKDEEIISECSSSATYAIVADLSDEREIKQIGLESADVVLPSSDLREVPRMVMLSRAVFRIISENLFWAFFYNICGVPLAAGVIFAMGGPMLDPAFCAGAMAASSLTVVLNALRLKRWKPSV